MDETTYIALLKNISNMDETTYIKSLNDIPVDNRVEYISNAILTNVLTYEKHIEKELFDGIKERNAVKANIRFKDDEIFNSCTKKEDYEKYCSVFKNGMHFTEAQGKIKQFKDKEEKELFDSCKTITEYENYLKLYPTGKYSSEARYKIQELNDKAEEEKRLQEEREKMKRTIKENVNEYDTDDIKRKLSDADLKDLCSQLGLDVKLINDYKEPTLIFGDIPKNASEIPNGYTDVFFWGIPSSGKTCALSVIFNTIKKEYAMEEPIDIKSKFGAAYRNCLTNIFNKEFGFLPSRTIEERTQYIPFLLYKYNDIGKRKISFFELSGEVFKRFYEITNGVQLPTTKREIIEEAFKALELLLGSSNQKIHFFFIDYNKETNHSLDEHNLTQKDYLTAAATYFRDAKDGNGKDRKIFQEKTIAVYIIVTKSDEIKSDNTIESATAFLNDNFGNFMNVLRTQCNQFNVAFTVKIFSIGDVYFKKICKINRKYSQDIIKDLLTQIPTTGSNGFLGKLKKLLNS